MEVNRCLSCISSCCALEVEINREGYNKIKAIGLSSLCTKHSHAFIAKNPKYRDKESFLDNLYRDNFAILNKKKSGFCVFLNEQTRLCSIYQNRPDVCKDFLNTSEHCKKIYKCIK